MQWSFRLFFLIHFEYAIEIIYLYILEPCISIALPDALPESAFALQRVEEGCVPEPPRAPDGLLPEVHVQELLGPTGAAGGRGWGRGVKHANIHHVSN